VTANLTLVGGDRVSAGHPRISAPQGLHSYGSEAAAVAALRGAGRELGAGLTEAMVRFAARSEYARTVEDVLARRWRLLFLDARLAASLAGEVGAILEQENGFDPQAGAFEQLARLYLAWPAATAV
jgi:glycerol-3-phosphate dehydrogenase